MGGPERAEALRQVPHRLVGLEAHHLRDAGMFTHERSHGAFGDVDELRVGMAPGDGPDERRSQQDVADRAETDEKNTQHAANVSLALPGFASRV